MRLASARDFLAPSQDRILYEGLGGWRGGSGRKNVCLPARALRHVSRGGLCRATERCAHGGYIAKHYYHCARLNRSPRPEPRHAEVVPSLRNWKDERGRTWTDVDRRSTSSACAHGMLMLYMQRVPREVPGLRCDLRPPCGSDSTSSTPGSHPADPSSRGGAAMRRGCRQGQPA